MRIKCLNQYSGDTRYIINLTKEEAIKISSEFDSNKLITMNKLCDELNNIKKMIDHYF